MGLGGGNWGDGHVGGVEPGIHLRRLGSAQPGPWVGSVPLPVLTDVRALAGFQALGRAVLSLVMTRVALTGGPRLISGPCAYCTNALEMLVCLSAAGPRGSPR